MFQPFEGTPNYPLLEKEILKFWETRQIFDKLRAQTAGGARFDFQDGPITANNPMGVHHAWGRTYKDIFNRFYAMQGRKLRWQNGFDCQGLWVEVEVEKALGFKGKPDILAFGMDNFSRACRERVDKYAEVISEQSKRLGMWMDWERSYFTHDDSNIEGIWGFLKKCHDEGWLAPDYRVMPWCPRCETSLSQHESADSYKDVTHRSVFLKFPIGAASTSQAPDSALETHPSSLENEVLSVTNQELASIDLGLPNDDDASLAGVDILNSLSAVADSNSSRFAGDYFLVWTTTPWTLTANVALAVNPELVYVRAKTDDISVILSKGTAQTALKAGYEIIEEISGADLVGLTYSGPFDDIPAQVESQNRKPRRVVAADWVGETEGTGIVHIAPGCGADDFDLGKAEDLGFITPVTSSAHFKSECGEVLAGLHALEDAETVFAELEKRGRLYRIQRYKHSYPHCWRCAHELIFFATQEWFIKADAGERPARGRLQRAASEVKWVPEYAGKRMQDWLNNMGDWNISRKRFWGLPLPIYRDAENSMWEIIGSRAELRERAVDAAKVDALPELHRPWIDEIEIYARDGKTILRRVPEVGDAWLDAGIVPFSTVGYNGASDIRMPELGISTKNEWQAADLVTEMREQVRLWFFSMLFMSVALEDKAPYKTAMVYETMLDENGEKISKTKKNGVPYDEAVETIGADPMRWTFAGNTLTKDIRFGYKPIHESARKLLTLWNVYGFFVTYANLDNPDLSAPLAPENILDKWILARLQTCIAGATSAVESVEIGGITREVEAFVEDLSNWYVRRSRRRFWKSDSDSDKQSAYRTLHHVLLTLCKLIAPVIPFSAENIYRNLSAPLQNAPESVHLCAWPKVDEKWRNDELVLQVEGVLQAVSLGLSARKESKIRARQPLSKALIQAPNDSGRQGIEAWRDTILDELNVKEIELLDDAGDLVTYSLKANLPVVGKRFGKQVGALRQALEKAEPSEAKRIGEAVKRGESVEIELNGETVTLEPNDVLASAQQQSGYSFASDNGWSVALDTTLSSELELEGLARDFVRGVQQSRKDSGLEVSDRIAILVVENEISRFAEVLENFGDVIQAETLADELRFVGADYPELGEAKMGEETLRFRVEKMEPVEA
ncbi:Isoleucyl-tRNA synthetase [Abditibacterium utsteinense]|uniref:Isoleucine--tRNA ligase n=1 Tax=Abditibacterium utsteinense TaxID=1960156 RepID=A0A2S8ST56_9BACT|nr:isoleucine--tRNA ligase [Abditibacterium utsteinense]PQV63929.1 Isoleucyl-tRNA synthetase [Abditibacterium utsteinense]